MKLLNCFFLAALAISVATARAAEIKVIANSSVGATSVSSDELKGVFLATKSSLSDGSHVEPVLLKSGAVHEAFSTDAEVVAYVEKTKGAIGYVASATPTASAKVLDVK